MALEPDGPEFESQVYYCCAAQDMATVRQRRFLECTLKVELTLRWWPCACTTLRVRGSLNSVFPCLFSYPSLAWCVTMETPLLWIVCFLIYKNDLLANKNDLLGLPWRLNKMMLINFLTWCLVKWQLCLVLIHPLLEHLDKTPLRTARVNPFVLWRETRIKEYLEKSSLRTLFLLSYSLGINLV